MAKQNKARYAPGELDKVRKNLGELDPAESQRMATLLGGEVGTERASQGQGEITRINPAKKRQYIPTKPLSEEEIKRQRDEEIKTEQITLLKKKSIPYLSPQERKAFYKLLTSPAYKISQKPGLFKLLACFGKASPDDLASAFVKTKIPAHVKHIDSFIDAMKNLIDSTTGEYKKKITTEDSPYFKALRYIYDWNTIMLTETSRTLASTDSPIMEDAIPVTKELFKHIMRLYFLGESKMAEIIKKLYIAATKPNSTVKAKNLAYAKQATAEWIYISSKIIHQTYPLLMRMTSAKCYPFPDFYTQNISKILPFLELTKYDLILPKKETKKDEQDAQPIVVPVTVETENEKNIIPNDISQSLNVLNNLFPNAGWNDLEKKPDMYPYFQPMYQFRDGFNVLSPSNPLQITIVLLRIIEDFFQGCRNIAFNIDLENADNAEYVLTDDSLQKIIAEWSQYREIMFNKMLCPELRDYVNRIYAQNDFKKSKFAKKQLSGWLWQMKYLFHPHLSFEIVFLERPAHDSTYKSLPVRIHQITTIFNSLIKNAKTEGQERNANFNTPYRFDVENAIAFRLNVLLGGEKSELKTNLNLMKYTLHALKVLDWWVNDKNSLAYRETIEVPYRTETENGEPSFSAPLRSNQKELFLHYAKKRSNEQKKDDISNETSENDIPPKMQAEESNTEK